MARDNVRYEFCRFIFINNMLNKKDVEVMKKAGWEQFRHKVLELEPKTFLVTLFLRRRVP